MENYTPDKKKDHLSTEYYKARRQLMLFSGTLLAWELIGLELNSNVAVDALNLNFTIKSPQAAPWVLIILIVYFSVRTMIEWHQSPIERRVGRASKGDAMLSTMIPILSIFVFFVQTISKVQIADFFSNDNILFLIIGTTIPLWLSIGYLLIKDNHNKKELITGWLFIIGDILIIAVATYILFNYMHIQQEFIIEGITYNKSKALFSLVFFGFGLIIGTISVIVTSHNFIINKILKSFQ